MSTFKKFDPEKPGTWPEFPFTSDDGSYKESDWWITHTSAGQTGEAMLCHREGGVSWETYEGRRLENVISYHPLPIPDDGMVMVPEELDQDALNWFSEVLNGYLGATGAIKWVWSQFINHFKGAKQ